MDQKDFGKRLGDISHDVRTPMGGVVGMLELLNESETLSDTDKSYVEIALRSARSLIRLLDDFFEKEKASLSLNKD